MAQKRAFTKGGLVQRVANDQECISSDFDTSMISKKAATFLKKKSQEATELSKKSEETCNSILRELETLIKAEQRRC
jgi:hypothetical protein